MVDHVPLRESPIFEGMDERAVTECVSAFEPVQVGAGQEILREDEYGLSFFIVVRGTVEVVVGGERVQQHGPGDYFGERALVTGERRNATVVALEDGELARVMAWDFNDLMNKNHTLAARLRIVAALRS